MRRWFLLTIFLLYGTKSLSQYFEKEQKLVEKIKASTNERQRVLALGDLASFYYIYRAEAKGDSVLQLQTTVAEQSDDKNLMLAALFGDALAHISSWSSSATFDRAVVFLNKGLQYARETGQEKYEVLAYIRLAAVYRKRGQYDKGLDQAALALSFSNHSINDSLRCVALLETGDLFLEKGDALAAYKNYNSAYDLAYSIKNIPLQSETYHHISVLYDGQHLANPELSRSVLQKSLELNKKHKNEQGLLQDYRDLARITDEKLYLDRYRQLAAKLQSEPDILYGKILMLAYLMTVEKDKRAALAYLNLHPDLRQSYLNRGAANYLFMLGNIYRYAGDIDSATVFYSRALPQLSASYDANVQKSALMEIADTYMQKDNETRAIELYERALNISREQHDFKSSASILQQLSRLYASSQNYQSAFESLKNFQLYNDTLASMAAERNMALMEVDRENKKHEKDMEDLAAERLRTRNLQYIGITIAIAAVFTFMLLMGMFPVSKFTIKLLSFFAFICLFEFIVLLVETRLHEIAHGEPLKIWLGKILLIAALVPIQHFLEHGVNRFMASQRLLRMRESISLRKMWTNIKLGTFKAKTPQESSVDEDTAVL